MAVTVEAWRAVGGFREDLFSSEDAIFGEAVVGSGRQAVLAVDAEVTWDQHPSLRATARMFYRYGMWGARGASFRLVRRDLLRAAAYLAAPFLLLRGSSAARAAVAAAGAVYLSLPLARCVRGRRGPGVFLALPLALVVKDTAKAAGCLAALCQIAWRATDRPTAPRRRRTAGGPVGTAEPAARLPRRPQGRR
jgi:hypothetical protein